MVFNTHDDYIAAPSSEKIILAHIHGSKRLFNFTLDGALYSRTTPHFVNEVTDGATGLPLTRVTSTGAVTDATEFYFDINTSKLYLFAFNQLTSEVIVSYRLFFSNLPINLSWDLTDSGTEVEYDARISKSPLFKSNMSQGKKGINLVSGGNLSISNGDGEYDDIFDTLFFENADCLIYTYNRDLAESEAQIIFRGIITGKSYNNKAFTFKVSDSLYKLDNLIPSDKYGTAVRDADINRNKRVIYGRVDNVLCQSIDQYGSGIALTGTIGGSVSETFIKGTGTSFLTELSEGDVLTLSNGVKQTINAVKTDTFATVSEITGSFIGLSATNLPKIQDNNKNRVLQLSGHAIKKYSTTISSVRSSVRFSIADTTGFNNGDTIFIDGEEATILRISNNEIRLTTFTTVTLTTSLVVTKREVENIRYGKDGNVIDNAEITVSNISAGVTMTLSADAELSSVNWNTNRQLFTFTNGERTIHLGTAQLHSIQCVANTSGSLSGKYFVIQDVDGTTTALWFDSTVTSPAEPVHGASQSRRILLPAETMTATEVATECVTGILTAIDYFEPSQSTDTITLRSVIPEAIGLPTANTSGFTISPTAPTAGVALSGAGNLTNILKPRDYVRVDGSASKYQVMSVRNTSITLTTPFSQTTTSVNMQYKSLDYINDTTEVYCNCNGKTDDGLSSGNTISTGADVIKDILTSISLSANIDASTFTDASLRANQTISMVIPANVSDTNMPQAKSLINRINSSVVGSLYVTKDLNLGYDILDTDTSLDTLQTITDNDIYSWAIRYDSFDLVKTVNGEYKRLEYDPGVGGSNISEVSYTSPFVANYIANTNTKTLSYTLYNTAETQEMVEREVLINSLSNSSISIKGSLSLSKFRLGERVILNLDRLPAIQGVSPLYRMGLVISIKNTGTSVELVLEDVGSLFSRTARMTSETALDYSAASADERVQNAYITDENDIVDTDEDTFNTNLIG